MYYIHANILIPSIHKSHSKDILIILTKTRVMWGRLNKLLMHNN